jgi:uncharacterized protein
MSGVILDTGPLVAYLIETDNHHEWVCEQMASMETPFWTCEAVLTEAMFLVRTVPRLREAIVQMLGSGFLKINFQVADQHSALLSMIERYNNVPMSLADACIVRMAELLPQSHVFTLDSDFHVYRKNTRHVIPSITPPR